MSKKPLTPNVFLSTNKSTYSLFPIFVFPPGLSVISCDPTYALITYPFSVSIIEYAYSFPVPDIEQSPFPYCPPSFISFKFESNLSIYIFLFPFS